MRQLSIVSHDNPVASKLNEKTDEFESNNIKMNEEMICAARAEQTPMMVSPEANPTDKPGSEMHGIHSNNNNHNNTSTINIIKSNNHTHSNNTIQINFVTYNSEKTNDINKLNNKN